jgi:hypothetical protein
MKIINISGELILSKLKIILKQDIDVLGKMLDAERNKDVVQIISNLINAKYIILDIISKTGERKDHSIIHSTKPLRKTHYIEPSIESNINRRFIGILKNIEKDQFEFIKKVFDQGCNSLEVENILSAVLDKYTEVINQLDRSLEIKKNSFYKCL